MPLPLATATMDWIQALGVELGLLFQAEKTVYPTSQIEYLGLGLDSILMQAHLPEDKLAYLCSKLRDWIACQSCSLCQIQELIRYLHSCSQVIPTSQAFIRRLIDFSTTFPPLAPNAWCSLPSSAHADLCWWHGLSSA